MRDASTALRLAPLIAAGLVPGLTCCHPAEDGDVGAASADAHPPGTVLLVAGEAIRAEEVDRVAEAVAELYPEYTLPHRRRLALTNHFLPRAAARAAQPDEREVAREACRAARERIDSPGSTHIPAEGSWSDLGFEVWLVARELEVGAWCDPRELSGRFVLVRVEERRPELADRGGWHAVSLVEFPYLTGPDPLGALEEAIDAARLEIVDPRWAEVVPERWKYRMERQDR